jgi:hypothetical protein
VDVEARRLLPLVVAKHPEKHLTAAARWEVAPRRSVLGVRSSCEAAAQSRLTGYLLQAAILAVSVPAARMQSWIFLALSIDGPAFRAALFAASIEG